MVGDVRPPGPVYQSPQKRKLYLLADEIFGKDARGREERLELSRYLLRRDITSWATLEDAQILRLLDALEGHHLVETLLAQRPPESGTLEAHE